MHDRRERQIAIHVKAKFNLPIADQNGAAQIDALAGRAKLVSDKITPGISKLSECSTKSLIAGSPASPDTRRAAADRLFDSRPEPSELVTTGISSRRANFRDRVFHVETAYFHAGHEYGDVARANAARISSAHAARASASGGDASASVTARQCASAMSRGTSMYTGRDSRTQRASTRAISAGAVSALSARLCTGDVAEDPRTASRVFSHGGATTDHIRPRACLAHRRSPRGAIFPRTPVPPD